MQRSHSPNTNEGRRAYFDLLKDLERIVWRVVPQFSRGLLDQCPIRAYNERVRCAGGRVQKRIDRALRLLGKGVFWRECEQSDTWPELVAVL
jgi:hypothetical protein